MNLETELPYLVSLQTLVILNKTDSYSAALELKGINPTQFIKKRLPDFKPKQIYTLSNTFEYKAPEYISEYLSDYVEIFRFWTPINADLAMLLKMKFPARYDEIHYEQMTIIPATLETLLDTERNINFAFEMLSFRFKQRVGIEYIKLLPQTEIKHVTVPDPVQENYKKLPELIAKTKTFYSDFDVK